MIYEPEQIPEKWLVSKIIPNFKKGDKKQGITYSFAHVQKVNCTWLVCSKRFRSASNIYLAPVYFLYKKFSSQILFQKLAGFHLASQKSVVLITYIFCFIVKNDALVLWDTACSLTRIAHQCSSLWNAWWTNCGVRRLHVFRKHSKLVKFSNAAE